MLLFLCSGSKFSTVLLILPTSKPSLINSATYFHDLTFILILVAPVTPFSEPVIHCGNLYAQKGFLLEFSLLILLNNSSPKPTDIGTPLTMIYPTSITRVHIGLSRSEFVIYIYHIRLSSPSDLTCIPWYIFSSVCPKFHFIPLAHPINRSRPTVISCVAAYSV